MEHLAMKPFIKTRLMLCLLGALTVAGAAQAAGPQAAQSQAPAADAAPAAQSDAKKPDLNDRNCLRYTGTRISNRTDSKKQRSCNNGAFGRAYTREDLDRTGELNIADALRKLDPSVH